MNRRVLKPLAVSIILVWAVATREANADSVGVELRAQCLVGNELRLVVETYRTWQPLFAHSSKTGDAKGYYIAIDLSAKQPLASRAHVVGPLWDVPNVRSSISFDAGAHYSQDDVNAALATPACIFDTDGTLLRFTRAPSRNTMTRDALVATP